MNNTNEPQGDNVKVQCAPEWLALLMEKHRLPESFREVAVDHYIPVAAKVVEWKEGIGRTLILGVNGAQGTGKSTMADVLSSALKEEYGYKVAALSLDDIYLTKLEREQLGEDVHPLLATRGVPGTHDVALGIELIEKAKAGDMFEMPQFDKSVDDRAIEVVSVDGELDVLILEGWCVGARNQDDGELAEPMNELESTEDVDGEWRTHVNDALAGSYQQLFDLLDRLIMLKAPSFECVYEWRGEQERKLRDAKGDASGVMSESELKRFIMHYERLTRWMLEEMPERANVVLRLTPEHGIEK
eukprot:Seg14186.3 transcript_id=Seg14186.3/GoldUCD/mRNA.D3Y31 product="putative kinase mug58" protein_id=Seg14186.3/GoldUCD/D3Y31